MSIESKEPKSVPTLFYCDGPGLVEAIRLCLVIGNIDFHDVRVERHAWEPYYEEVSPSDKTSWLEVNGRKFFETRAILLYAARLADLAPSDLHDAMHAASLLDEGYDAMHSFLKTMQNQVDTVPQEKAAANGCRRYLQTGSLSTLDSMAARSQDVQGHVLGQGRLTYIDVFLATIFNMITSHMPDIEVSFPALGRVHKLVYRLKAVKEWSIMHPASVQLSFAEACPAEDIISLALDVAGVPYTKFKRGIDENKVQNLPVLTLNEGSTLTGFGSILTWVNAILQWTPLENENALQIDSIIDAVYEVWKQSNMLAKDDSNGLAKIQEELRRIDKNFFLRKFERVSVRHGVTPADIALAAYYGRLLTNESCGLSPNDLPAFRESYVKVNGLSSVKQALMRRQEPELYSLDSFANGESIRWLFAITGIQFRDIRAKGDEWVSTVEPKNPTGQWPYVRLANGAIGGTVTILRHLAKLTRLEPLTFTGGVTADVLANMLDRSTSVVEAKPVGLVEVEEQEARAIANAVERYLVSMHCGKHVVENRLTWIDILVAATFESWTTKRPFLNLKDYPAISKIQSSVNSLPRIIAHKSSSKVLQQG